LFKKKAGSAAKEVKTALTDIVRVVRTFRMTWDHLQQSEEPGSSVVGLKQSWAAEIFARLNMKPVMKGEPFITDQPLILVGNHTSYLDIPLLIRFYPEVCFVSKHEVKNWPIIGPAATKVQTIFVRRNSYKSRKTVRSQITQALKEENKKVAVFPSGTTHLLESEKWKKGVLEIAKEEGIQVQPFRIRYSPPRLAAYIGKDFLPVHMYSLYRKGGLKVVIEFRTPLTIEDVEKDMAEIKTWCEASVEPVFE
jgi:1-acyl-sn-glycerol-3-phosphate acyltransferase